MNRTWYRRGLLALAVLASTEVAATVHDYTVTVSASLDSVAVEARPGEAGSVLGAPRGRTADLRRVEGCDRGGVRVQARRLVADGRCVRYEASLVVPPDETGLRPHIALAGHERWLWIPRLEEGDRVRIALRLPEGANAFVPWRAAGPGTWDLLPSPGSGEAMFHLGDFEPHALQVDGAALPLAVLEPVLDSAAMWTWLTEAASLVADVGGGFPNPHAKVVVQRGEASAFGDSVVPFGHVMRSGEEVVRFFVKPDASLAQLRADWTAVHEFAHLLLPYVRDEQKWISEGFASYYQNILLARGGIYSETEAWQRLARSFAAARAGGGLVSPNDTATRPFWDVRMLIYWSGAAIALMADVELRTLSDGEQSLDTVLGRLRACCLPSPRVWEGAALFAKLDALSSTKVFSGLYAKYADRPGMPDVDPVLASLGVRLVRGEVRLSNDAPHASIRRVLTRRPVPGSALNPTPVSQ